ncbi:MAG: DNA gyrase subunit A [Thermoguttaceae bacterium]
MADDEDRFEGLDNEYPGRPNEENNGGGAWSAGSKVGPGDLDQVFVSKFAPDELKPYFRGTVEINGKPYPNLTLDDGTTIWQRPIFEEMEQSYLDYSMSVIVSRAIPDVRDGLKPSQRRILVAMNDLRLGPSSQRVKCAKISGDASGNYHPHGEAIIYPTLARMAQEWNMRHVLVDKQGNFGSIAGLPPAAMRYTEARLSGFATAMLEDLEYETVDFMPTYDGMRMEPVVLPSKAPNLLINGSNGIAVGMSTSIPPHNLGEVCDAAIALIDNPETTILELLHHCPGPDFPTGGVICGLRGVRRGYMTGRSTIVVRAHAKIERNAKNNRERIVISEIPYQQARDNIEKKIAEAVTAGSVGGVSAIRNESDLKEPVRLVLDLKKDADAHVTLNQLYQYTPLQSSFSMILLALVDGKPRVMSLKELLEEFLRHRRTVIRRRTNFLLKRAVRRQHTVEGLLIAHANIDEIIETIKTSPDQATAKQRIMQIACPAALLQRALGAGFEAFTEMRGVKESYTLTPVQADAILRVTLGQLARLEQEKLGNEYNSLLEDITEYRRILSDEANIMAIVRDDLLEIKKKFADKRRTDILPGEITEVDDEDLIEEETMVVSITQEGYIKRTPLDDYKAQRRGGVGVKGAKVAEEDPVQHLFVSSTHNYLMFFTNRGNVYWQKVYGIPQSSRDGKGRNIVNLLSLEKDETIASCLAIRDFKQPGAYLVMATRDGLVKKTRLSAYKRPRRTGLIAIRLRGEDSDVQSGQEQKKDSNRPTPKDELVAVDVCQAGDEIMLTTASGRTIRFSQSDVRPMGRVSSGVRGVKLRADDVVVGMTIAEENSYLLNVSANGYAKRTLIGPNVPVESDDADDGPSPDQIKPYPTKRRGGLGVLDMKTTKRNGAVVAALRVEDDDELMVITKNGMIQRLAASSVRVTGRNTNGVILMKLRKGDEIAAVNRVPNEDVEETEKETVGVSKEVVGETYEETDERLDVVAELEDQIDDQTEDDSETDEQE